MLPTLIFLLIWLFPPISENGGPISTGLSLAHNWVFTTDVSVINTCKNYGSWKTFIVKFYVGKDGDSQFIN